MTFDYGVARIRPATVKDAAYLAPRLRPEDVRELDALTETPAADVLRASVLAGGTYAVELASGEVVALFGASQSPEPMLGNVWLVGSPALLKIKLAFLRHSKEWVGRLFGSFRLLGNIVDERNTVHVNWLRWLGFRFLRRVPIGRNGEVFIEFVKLPEDDT